MSRYILSVCVIGVLLFFGSCQKDNEQFLTSSSKLIHGNTIVGVVVDENDNALEGAQVVFGELIVFTNQFGFYQFENVSLDSRHNSLRITKQGYFESARTFRTNITATIEHTTQLFIKNFTNSFESSEGGAIEQGEVELNFPPNSIVLESNGSDYTGTVRVAIQYLDPTLENIIQIMPGDFSAVNMQGEYSTLVSYGMVYVEMQSVDGEKLQIKEGYKASLSAEIPSSIFNDSPETIQMWVFDEALGMWKEEGAAQKLGSKYVGEVSHFSCWNFDSPTESIIACGRVVDQNGNPLRVFVRIASIPDNAIGQGATGSNGSFCGPVAKGKPLRIEVYSPDCGPWYVNLGEVGPFDSDVNLGELTLVLDDNFKTEIIGSAVDCDGSPLTQGTLYVNDRFTSVITDGTFNVPIIKCADSLEFKVRVIDNDGLKESEEFVLSGTGPFDLNEITTCQDDVFFLDMHIDDLGFSVVGTDNASASEQTVTGQEWNYLYSRSFIENSLMSMRYEDFETNKFAIGTFSLNELSFTRVVNVNEESYRLVNGTVSITEMDEVGNFIRGNYTALIRKVNPPHLEYTFYGNFKLEIK